MRRTVVQASNCLQRPAMSNDVLLRLLGHFGHAGNREVSNRLCRPATYKSCTCYNSDYVQHVKNREAATAHGRMQAQVSWVIQHCVRCWTPGISTHICTGHRPVQYTAACRERCSALATGSDIKKTHQPVNVAVRFFSKQMDAWFASARPFSTGAMSDTLQTKRGATIYLPMTVAGRLSVMVCITKPFSSATSAAPVTVAHAFSLKCRLLHVFPGSAALAKASYGAWLPACQYRH